MAYTKTILQLPNNGTSEVSQSVSTESSPDSRCPICIDRLDDVAYVSCCLHKFCFCCIREWSKNNAECPLCKQPFNSIYYSIKADNDFKEFFLEPTKNSSPGSPDHSEFTNPTRQTPVPSPDDVGVLKGPLQKDVAFHRVMSVMAARRRAQNEGRTVHHLREQEMILFRHALYRTGLRVRRLPDGSRYRDISAAFFQRNPACLHRLLPWLLRELVVLLGTHNSLVNLVLHIILLRITRYNMEDDQVFHKELQPFLLTYTDHFLHEFISFARSPFNIEAYDQHAMYDCPAPSYEEGSSSDSSVIAISEDKVNFVELSQQPGPIVGSALSQAPWDDETPGPSYSTTEPTEAPAVSASGSESASNREEPKGLGNPLQENAQVKNDLTANDNTDASSGEDDCVIVGYVKPMAGRTPELVQLSSDSEESIHLESTEGPPESQVVRFPSPTSSMWSPASIHKSLQRLKPYPWCSGLDCTTWTSEPKQRHTHSKRDPSRMNRDGNTMGYDGKFKGMQRRNLLLAGMIEAPKSRSRSRSRSKESSCRSHSRQPRSTYRSWSARSPTVSVKSDSTLSRDRGHSRSLIRDRLRYTESSQSRRRDKSSGRSRQPQDRA